MLKSKLRYALGYAMHADFVNGQVHIQVFGTALLPS